MVWYKIPWLYFISLRRVADTALLPYDTRCCYEEIAANQVLPSSIILLLNVSSPDRKAFFLYLWSSLEYIFVWIVLHESFCKIGWTLLICTSVLFQRFICYYIFLCFFCAPFLVFSSLTRVVFQSYWLIFSFLNSFHLYNIFIFLFHFFPDNCNLSSQLLLF